MATFPPGRVPAGRPYVQLRLKVTPFIGLTTSHAESAALGRRAIEQQIAPDGSPVMTFVRGLPAADPGMIPVGSVTWYAIVRMAGFTEGAAWTDVLGRLAEGESVGWNRVTLEAAQVTADPILDIPATDGPPWSAWVSGTLAVGILFGLAYLIQTAAPLLPRQRD